ncbi:MAG: LLM class F420-dependent oxidoreductase [Candidatus Thorarchaeota archaeon]
MSRIRFGIQIEPQFGFDYQTVEQIALDAEKVGYDSIWSSDHFFLHDKAEELNCMESWTLLAALASKTTKLRLGTLVTCNSYRYPAVLAKIAATVDMISNGRLEFGIGAGWKELEYKAYGIPFPSLRERMDRLEEALQIIKMLWTEPKSSFAGKYYVIKDAFSAPKPVQNLPLIFIGGTGEKRILRMVAQYGDYCNFGWFTPKDKVIHLLEALKRHCEDVSRDYDSIGKSYFAYAMLADDEDRLEKLLASRAEERNISIEEFKKRMGATGAFVGTPEVIQQEFQELIDLGFDYFQVMFPYPDDYRASQDFAQTIMKKLR